MKKSLDSITPKTAAKADAPVAEEPKKAAEPAVETPAKAPVEPTPPATPAVETVAPAEAKTEPATEPVDAATPAVPGTPAKEDTFEALFPEPSVAIAGPPSWIWWTLLLVASVVLGVLGYGLARNHLNGWLAVAPKATPTPTVSVSATPTATPTATASATPTPTPTPTPAALAKKDITLRVLNGTTTTGAAGAAKTILEKDGFTVRTTGNAKTQDYLTTVIYYQTGHEAEAKLVQTGLPTYSTTLTESTLSNPDMVLVVIGKK